MWKLTITVYIASLVIIKAQDETTTGTETTQEPGTDTSTLAPDYSQCINTARVCPNVNITFWLYSRSTQDNPYQLTVDNIKEAPYKNNVSFVVLIHGYTGNKDYAPNPELRKALFDKDEYNIISVDYAPIAKEPCYVQAAYNVRTVANCTARLLLEMINEIPDVINIDNLHVIGFSLGAQVAGNIGYYFKSLGNMKLKWLTALDPALPLFDSILIGPDSRISPDDAEFVDVYHTDAGNKGIVRPAGQVDFYLNNGYEQPGCGSNSSCDHYRAVLYYGESINENSIGFWGAPCKVTSLISYFTATEICKARNGQKTTVLMGYYTPHTTTGTYKVVTNSTPPFALGKNPKVGTRTYGRSFLFK